MATLAPSAATVPTTTSGTTPGTAGPPPESVNAQLFASHPALAKLGPIFKSSKVVELTESETEYVVGCVKHVLAQHVVFQVHSTHIPF